MTAELYQGSLPAQVLDQLTTAMGMENRLGAADDARLGAPPRVTWVPPTKGTRRYSETAQQRPDLHIKHVHDVAPLYHVHLWGESYTACEQLEQQLEAALYDVFSPNAYELGPEGEQDGDNSPTGQGRGWVFVVPVRLLRSPLPVARFKPVTLATATARGQVTDPKGNNPTNGPSPSVTIPP